MDKKLTFDEDIMNYDKWRPKYVPQLFADIIRYSGIDSNKRAVEVGCGTGQATGPILKTGCSLVAVECGRNFSAYVQEKYKNFPGFKVINMEFEKYPFVKNSVDLLFSATAFHWIPENEGYTKTYDILKSGATLALFWNRPFVNKQDDPLHQCIQSIYNRFRPQDSGKKNLDIEHDQERFRHISGTIKKHRFINLEYSIYKQTRSFFAEDYISLLNTYSDHQQMSQPEKSKFEFEIKAAIQHHGGILTIYDTMDLYLAQKP